MIKGKRLRFDSYRDGFVEITKPGETEPFLKLPFASLKLSLTRYFTALSTETEITKVIKVPLHENVEASYTATINGGKSYVVKLTQSDYKAVPPCSILSLGDKNGSNL